VTAEDRAFLIAQGSMFLIAAAAFQFFDGVAMTLSGALRGAGDTAWLGVVTVALAWTLIVGGGLAMVTFVPSLSSLGPWVAAAAYIICLGTVTGLRYHGGKWKSIKLVDRPGA
jgi:MATE family multidrug resistance protein